MLELPNGNRCSQPKITPVNYKKLTSTKKDWMIDYRFYSDQYPMGKRIRIKNFNVYKDYPVRKEMAERDLKKMIIDLQNGYNPITGKMVLPPDHEAGASTPLSDALLKGAENVICVKHTKEVMMRAIRFLNTVAKELKLHLVPVGDIRKKHIRKLLERASEIRSFTPGNYNHHRSYLMMAFRELSELDAIESNPVIEIRKRKEVRTIRETLSLEERDKVNKYLQENYYSFWRYLHIFFHSGSRSSELLRVQCKDVNILKQYFKITVIKGNKKMEVRKIMKDVVVELWVKAIKGGKPNDFVFAKGLKPGPVSINEKQITRRWYNNVKGGKNNKHGLNITADFYSLKHIASDETSRLLSIEHAMLQNSHESVITTGIYAVNEKERQAERLKKINNKFA